jgi:hypothetical protein
MHIWREGIKTRNKEFLVSILITAFLIFIFSFQPNLMNAHAKDVQIGNIAPSANPERVNLSIPGGLVIKEHKMTVNEVEALKSQTGVYQVGENYNQIVDGYGTGLRLPSSAEWSALSQSSYVIDSVSSSNTPSSFDNSNSPYFPPIGNQGHQGSCTAWSVGYYIATFLEAKEHGWNLTGATWTGSQPTGGYQSKIMSPAFVYNLINNGHDGGLTWMDAINLICKIGVCSWANMPYNQDDYVSWPTTAAWTEAPFYRGNSSSYQFLDTSLGNVNLKNLLAAQNLATITVDANEFTNLSQNDVWTLENYHVKELNHAGTIVGYDDNFSYNESGQVKYGAFKVANSWGVGFWENTPDGSYWISYDAMSSCVGSCYYYFPQTNYQPSLFATFNIQDNARGNCQINVGLGNPAKPVVTKFFMPSGTTYGGSQPFCLNNIVMDISEFKSYMSSSYNQSFFLKVYDNQNDPANGNIVYFAVGNWNASGTPCQTIPNQNVFLNVTYNPYLTSNITLLPAGQSNPLSNTDYFLTTYFIDGQSHVAYAQNGTLTLIADSNTNITISEKSSSSNASEQWLLNSQSASVTIPTGTESTFYYYDLLSQQVAYSVISDGNSISPTLIYYNAPSFSSSQFTQNATSIILSSAQQTIQALRNTTVTVSRNILHIVPPALFAQAQWVTPISSWSINRINQIPTPIVYYYQYQFNATYATSEKSIPSSTPRLFGTQFGVNYQLPLSISNQSTWLDANTIWLTNATLTAPSGTERWNCFTGTSGIVTGATSINSTYVHQYYLTINSPHGSPSGSEWYNNGAYAHAILLSDTVPVEVGTQYIFSGWTGEASGSNMTSDSIIMNSPKTATAIWNTQYQLTFEVMPSGGASTTPTGANLWVNSGPLSITASPNSGYTFSQWTADSSSIAFENSSSGSTIANVDGPGKIMASLTLLPTPTPSPTTAPTAIPTIGPTTTPTSTLTPATSPASAPTTSPSSTPAIPEFPSVMILAILMIILTHTFVLIVRKKRKPRS